MDNPIIRIHACSFANKELTAVIDFPITKEQINDIFRKLGIDDKDESEISFEDIECPVNGIFDVVYPEASFEDINRLALLLGRMSDKSRHRLSDTFLTVIDDSGEVMDIKEVIKTAKRLNGERVSTDTPNGKITPKSQKRRDMDAR